jgi:hypothetical protein
MEVTSNVSLLVSHKPGNHGICSYVIGHPGNDSFQLLGFQLQMSHLQPCPPQMVQVPRLIDPVIPVAFPSFLEGGSRLFWETCARTTWKDPFSLHRVHSQKSGESEDPST